jgi:tetratricopeptide (TPR) repeat protein
MLQRVRNSAGHTMTFPDLHQIRAAVAREPENAELRYLLGAELAQQREYDAAVIEMRTALKIDPNLHFARLQLGLLYLTMAQPNESLEIWAPLEELDEAAALKAFKRGLEALIRDDFPACIGYLQQGIQLNTQNAPLNHDMSMIIDRVREAGQSTVQPAPVEPSQAPTGVRTDFSLYGDPANTKH